MNLTLLRTFVAVAERRHFGRAASACHLSQPAVSHQMAQLEQEVGAKLLNRAPRRVSLTVAGETLLEEARRILAAVDRARERLQEVAAGAVGRIRLGATATPGLYVLPPLLARYREAHPSFDLQFHVGAVDDIAQAVARNDLDMAVIAGRPPGGELRDRPLRRDELVLVRAPFAGLGASAPAQRADLERQTWILREPGSATRREVDAWMHRHRLHLPRSMTFNGPDAVKRAVMAGLGVSLLSRLTIEDDVKTRRLAPVKVRMALPAWDICLIDHPHKHHGAACRAMLALLGATFKVPLSAAGS